MILSIYYVFAFTSGIFFSFPVDSYFFYSLSFPLRENPLTFFFFQLKNLFFRAVLSSQQITAACTEFPHPSVHPIQPPPPPASLIVVVRLLRSIDELTLKHHYNSKSTVYIRIHSLCYTFYGFCHMYNDMHRPL